jgi:putative ABC transport system permease protein
MFLETFFQDLRIGLRVLIKEKSFCVLAVSVLAVGICAVTTQYAVLLRGFNFRSSERLVDVQLVDPNNFTPSNFNARITTADFVDLKAQTKSFDAFIGYLNGSTVNFTYQGQPKRPQGGYVTWDFFRTLGVSPALGRDFLIEEDRPIDKAVLLSDALWRSNFGANADIIGKPVRVNGRAAPLTAFLFQTSPFDPLIYGVVALLLTLVCVLAMAVPARRATRVDPMIALRAG